jgi:hypothetical protein
VKRYGNYEKKCKLNMEIEPMKGKNPVSRAAAAAIYSYLFPAACACTSSIILRFTEG